MFTIDDLADRLGSYLPQSEIQQVKRAFYYAEQAHDGQCRRSGEPYVTHPLAVANILANMHMDHQSLMAAMLHDVIEDTGVGKEALAKQFGKPVAELVDGVSKLTQIAFEDKAVAQAENFQKMVLAMSRDIRVIIVKLADRLHNMRTIKSMRPDKQGQKARETMEIYAPLAGRMGMQWMRDELEDLAFRVLNPEARNSIIRRFLTLQREAGDVVHKISADIRAELESAGIEADVYGRAKKPYSVWRKMREKELAFSRLSDIYGFRVICEEVPDCYRILGLIHQRWRAVPGRFKDYISQPKSNGYRSIHTTVSGRDGKRVEVQIRTRAMHEVAEAGVAAHWAYRDGERVANPFAVDPARWISTLTEQVDAGGHHDEFLEQVKLEMYSDQVFCFTPKGDVVQLPRGATPLDFAYAIHTRIGDSCVSARVDGIRVPLWTRLRNGQSVEIITAEGQRPQTTWIDLVVTGRAKAAIRRSLREEDRARFVRLGQELARVAFEHVGRKATDKALATAATRLGVSDRKELLARLGSAEITARQVVAALYPELAAAEVDEVDARRPVVGLPDAEAFRRAECCQPLPGERIVGITYRGIGVVAHAIDCLALEEFEETPERWIDLRWHDGRHAPAYTVALKVTISNDAGVLGRICTLIGEQGANISDLRFADRKPDYYRLIIEVDLRDLAHMHAVMTALEADSDVAELARHRDMQRKP